MDRRTIVDGLACENKLRCQLAGLPGRCFQDHCGGVLVLMDNASAMTFNPLLPDGRPGTGLLPQTHSMAAASRGLRASPGLPLLSLDGGRTS